MKPKSAFQYLPRKLPKVAKWYMKACADFLYT